MGLRRAFLVHTLLFALASGKGPSEVDEALSSALASEAASDATDAEDSEPSAEATPEPSPAPTREPTPAPTPETPEPTQAQNSPSLYCFALVAPGTAEPQMVAAQFLLKTGIFSCDGYDIISNVSADELFEGEDDTIQGLKDNVFVVDSNLTSSLVNGHLANTPIFQVVWKKVFSIKRFINYDWTLKLDTDAVILPGRLKKKLVGRPFNKIKWDPGFPDEELPFKAEYMLNSDKDTNKNMLHGPVELLSKGAMQIYQQGVDRCENKVVVQNYGPLALGEDYYLNRCLSLLGIPSVPKNQTDLLYDKYEYGAWATDTCKPKTVTCCPVAGRQYYNGAPINFDVYHYYKDIYSWLKCYNEASEVDGTDIIPHSRLQEVLTAVSPLAIPTPRPTPAPTPWPTAQTPAPTSWTTQYIAPGACHTAVPGETCYQQVQWAKSSGIHQHPDWYAGTGLTAQSTLAQFQTLVHTRNPVKCPHAPCSGRLKLFQQHADDESLAGSIGSRLFSGSGILVGIALLVSVVIALAARSRRTSCRAVGNLNDYEVTEINSLLIE